MSWEGLAVDRTKWRSALKQHLKTGGDKRMTAAADKRARRKEGGSSIRPETTHRYSYGKLNCDGLHILRKIELWWAAYFNYLHLGLKRPIITPLLTSTHKPVLARAPFSYTETWNWIFTNKRCATRRINLRASLIRYNNGRSNRKHWEGSILGHDVRRRSVDVCHD